METEGKRVLRDRLYSILATFGMMWLWLTLLVIAAKAGGIGRMSTDLETHPFVGVFANVAISIWQLNLQHLQASQLSAMFLMTCLLAPLAEEILFRALVCHAWAGDGKGNLMNWWPVLGISAVLFGFLHTFSYSGVLLQGMLGFQLAMLWYRNGPSQRWSYFSCVAAHGLYNLSVIGVTIAINRAVSQALFEILKKMVSGS